MLKKDKQPLCTYNRISIRIPGHVGEMMDRTWDNWMKPPRKSVTKDRYADNDMFDPRRDWIMSVGARDNSILRLSEESAGWLCKKYIPWKKKEPRFRPLQGVGVDRSNSEASEIEIAVSWERSCKQKKKKR
jgi:hypothetical protein